MQGLAQRTAVRSTVAAHVAFSKEPVRLRDLAAVWHELSFLSHSFTGSAALSDVVVRQTDFDGTVGQLVVSDRNLACAIIIRHKTLSDGEDKVCLPS